MKDIPAEGRRRKIHEMKQQLNVIAGVKKHNNKNKVK
jgi:hypothetical protein